MTKKPENVILIVVDTLRADRLSCYGYENETSPFLDSLAEEGMRFENAYSVASWTVPVHGSLFSGKLPSFHGSHRQSDVFRRNYLPTT
ncbi:MAG: sulfatase-like hydrolase/transferase [Halobacteriaceae archaeon]